jgi:hypothetical protein
MNSLLGDILSDLRAARFNEALAMLQVFLDSAYTAHARLESQCQTAVCGKDEIFARLLSSASETCDPQIETMMLSLESLISDAKLRLEQQEAEYRSCEPKLGATIMALTGRNYSDTVQNFMEDFKVAARSMAHRSEDLLMVDINGFLASYATVRGDGNCLFRAFLTVLAYQEANVVLPYDPEGLLEWIIRLKLLMCAHIQEIVKRNPSFESDLKSIPENGTVRTLQDYFVIFMRNGYQGTNYDCTILATMFEKPIHVIHEQQLTEEICQTFAPRGKEVILIEDNDIIILHQHGHFVAIIEVFRCDFQAAVLPGL